jgi:pimeloyl-ACP methyl ester carboxylesterase
MTVPVDRAFVRLTEGLVHYRHAGAGSPGVPVYLAHAGPGSSRGFAPLLGEIGETRWAIAPDMLGNGDSAPPVREDTDIAYYADCVVRVMDALGIEQIDFYGSHTGAMIGMELSQHHGDRVRKMVLDGVMLLDAAGRDYMVTNYAPKIVPDEYGGHMTWAYQFCRDMMLFYPYFERDSEHRTTNGVPDPATLHLMVTDVIKALTTYHCAYGAAFSYDAETALAKVTHTTLLTCGLRDPLHVDLPRAAAILPTAENHLYPLGTMPAEVAARIAAFLDA